MTRIRLLLALCVLASLAAPFVLPPYELRVLILGLSACCSARRAGGWPPMSDQGAMPGATLTVARLSRRFGGLLAVDDVSFAVPSRTIVALIGPNGAGKSTIVNLISGVLKPSTGRIRLRDRELGGLPPHAVARRGLVRTFQDGRLMPRLSVLDNVLLGADATCG